jgi:hypothetical protein
LLHGQLDLPPAGQLPVHFDLDVPEVGGGVLFTIEGPFPIRIFIQRRVALGLKWDGAGGELGDLGLANLDPLAAQPRFERLIGAHRDQLTDGDQRKEKDGQGNQHLEDGKAGAA